MVEQPKPKKVGFMEEEGLTLKPEPVPERQPQVVTKEEDLEMESIGGSSFSQRQQQKFQVKGTQKVVDFSLSKTTDNVSGNKLFEAKESLNITKSSDMNIPAGMSRSMGSTFSSTMFNPVSNQLLSTQPQKIMITKDLAEKAREEREKQRKEVLAQKPEIYYKAQAELR